MKVLRGYFQLGLSGQHLLHLLNMFYESLRVKKSYEFDLYVPSILFIPDYSRRGTTSSCSSLRVNSFGNSAHQSQSFGNSARQHQIQNCASMSPKSGKRQSTPTATTAVITRDDNLNEMHGNNSNQQNGHDHLKKAVKFHSDRVKVNPYTMATAYCDHG